MLIRFMTSYLSQHPILFRTTPNSQSLWFFCCYVIFKNWSSLNTQLNLTKNGHHLGLKYFLFLANQLFFVTFRFLWLFFPWKFEIHDSIRLSSRIFLPAVWFDGLNKSMFFSEFSNNIPWFLITFKFSSEIVWASWSFFSLDSVINSRLFSRSWFIFFESWSFSVKFDIFWREKVASFNFSDEIFVFSLVKKSRSAVRDKSLVW